MCQYITRDTMNLIGEHIAFQHQLSEIHVHPISALKSN